MGVDAVADMDAGYFNARVRGLKGRLIRAGDYASFIKADGEREYRDRLKSTGYGRDIEVSEAVHERPEEIIPSALRANLFVTFEKLTREAPAEARVFMKALLSQWEVFNLKAIIRAFARDVRREDLRPVLVPVGEFNGKALDMLLGAKDLNDLIRHLDTWGSPYAGPLKEAAAGRQRAADMERSLDRFTCAYLLSNLEKGPPDSRIIMEAVRFRIDAENILTLIKTFGEGFSGEQMEGFFIEGGALVGKDMFLRFSSLENREEAVDLLLRHVRDRAFREVLASSDFDEPAPLEEALEAELARRLRKAAVVDPLGMALPAAFIYMKVREVKNLRALAMAKVFDIPDEELKAMLVYGE